MLTWWWLYLAFVAGLYALIAVLRIRYWRQEAAQDARRAAMWRQLEAAGYYREAKPPPPEPPRRRWFAPDGVEIFED